MEGEYSDAHCNIEFSKERSKAAADRKARLEVVLSDLSTAPPGTPAQADAMRRYTAILEEGSDDTKGLRIDFEALGRSNNVRYCDISGVHTTAPTYINATQALLAKEAPALRGNPKQGVHLPHNPALERRQLDKHDKYQPIMSSTSERPARRTQSSWPRSSPTGGSFPRTSSNSSSSSPWTSRGRPYATHRTMVSSPRRLLPGSPVSSRTSSRSKSPPGSVASCAPQDTPCISAAHAVVHCVARPTIPVKRAAAG